MSNWHPCAGTAVRYSAEGEGVKLMSSSELPITFEDFRTHILQQAIFLRDDLGAENLDVSYPAASFSLPPEEFRDRQQAFSKFTATNEARLFTTYAMLEDDRSKSLFLALILFRLLGHTYVRLPSNDAVHRKALEQERQMEALPSTLDHLPGGGGLKHFRLQLEDEIISLDCLPINIRFSFFLRQYFFAQSDVLVAPQSGDHVIDAGGCFGDTAVNFARSVGQLGVVHTFEPLDTHLQVLHHNVTQNHCENIRIHAFGLGNVNRRGETSSGPIDPGHIPDVTVALRSLDSLVEEGIVERVDFIKVDVEGNELSVLQGAQMSILRFMPRMAISVYHNFDDYLNIPDYINYNFPGYRFFLDNHTISDAETVLYCLPSYRRQIFR